MWAEVSLPERLTLALALGQRAVAVKLEQPWRLAVQLRFSLPRPEPQPTGEETREQQPEVAAWLGWHSKHRLAWKYATDQFWS
jgi:hypothetical protein